MKTPDKSLEQRTERVVAFLNSRGVGFDTGTDYFSSSASASQFLKPLFGAANKIPPQALGGLVRLRDVLLDLVSSGWNDRTEKVLNRIAGQLPYTLDFRSEREAILTPVDAASIPSIVLRDVAMLVEAGQWNRIKNCSNEVCSASFFDHSRNRSQRWHSFELCGNKHNVAAHRARQVGD